MAGLGERTVAAYRAFRDAGAEPVITMEQRYALLWSWYAGTWLNAPETQAVRRDLPRVYKNARLLWNLSRATVRLYTQTVYQGDLPVDDQPLPDGSRGAIPILPRTGSAATDKALLLACAELWQMWNWRQFMSVRPKMAAILGDCLTEIVDDLDGARVVPRTVWPGYVVDLDLDAVGNVKRYALEYVISTPGGRRFGAHEDAATFLYRKEVDGKMFRYYRDGEPWDAWGEGAEVPNIYGFVPAVWDRHEVVWGDRGLGAFETAIQTAREMNGLVSHAIDYQRKQFAAPVGVIGRREAPARRQNGMIVLPDGTESPPTQLSKAPPRDAESQLLNMVNMDSGGQFVTVDFDIGKTLDLLKWTEAALVAENPEARFGQEILKMTQVTGPGVERALGPIINGVKQVRDNHDPQTTKLLQMSVAIMGERLRRGHFDADKVAARPSRYEPFRTFGLESYGKGQLDFGIPDRPVIPETPEERVARLLQTEQLQTEWAMLQAGMPPDVVKKLMAEKEQAAQRMADALGAGPAREDEGDGENDEGETDRGAGGRGRGAGLNGDAATQGPNARTGAAGGGAGGT